MSKPKQSEAEVLEQYRISLENAERHPAITEAIAELGYNSEKIAEGKQLHAATRKIYDLNMVEDDRTSAAYNYFHTVKNELGDIYKIHRKKAKVIFRKDPLMCNRLLISGTLSKAYIKWFEAVKKFYGEIQNDNSVSSQLLTLKVPAEELQKANSLIKLLETVRATYLKEKGASQDATEQKDHAFAKMDDWMRDFYAIARIALEEHPQLIEALGKHVKS